MQKAKQKAQLPPKPFNGDVPEDEVHLPEPSLPRNLALSWGTCGQQISVTCDTLLSAQVPLREREREREREATASPSDVVIDRDDNNGKDKAKDKAKKMVGGVLGYISVRASVSLSLCLCVEYSSVCVRLCLWVCPSPSLFRSAFLSTSALSPTAHAIRFGARMPRNALKQTSSPL